MSTTTPTRIGFIGLSQNGMWGPYAHLPYLQSPLGKKHYTIAALCNSTVDSAKSTITKFALDPSTKAYGSPEDLANDPDIDLVVCVTRLPLHAPTLKPVIAKGKRIICESPLGRSLAETQELVEGARRTGIARGDLAVVLQEPFDAGVCKVKELLESRVIGRVVHSSVDVAGDPLGSSVSERHAWAMKKENGAWAIVMTHVLNAVTFAMGPLADCSSRIVNAMPEASLLGEDGNVVGTTAKEIADHKVLAGQSKPTRAGYPGASFAAQLRSDARLPDEPMLTWRIMGEKGQLKITSPHMPLPELADGGKIEHFDYSTKAFVEIPWLRGAQHSEGEGILSSLTGPARTIGRLYEAFAKGEHVGTADWDSGLELFKLVDALDNKGEYKA